LGWVKIRIWDKHPGSATLAFGPPGSGFGSVIIGKDPNPAQTAQNFEKHVLKNQCCGSRKFIPDPDFYPSRIQKQLQKREVKKNYRTFYPKSCH
jgi:hypothetical protein